MSTVTLKRAIVMLLLACAFAAVILYDPDPKRKNPVPEGVYFGFWMPYENGLVNEAAIIQMEHLIDKEYALQMVFFDILEDSRMLQSRLKQLKRLGKTPVVILELHVPPPHLQSIIDGKYDDRFARVARVMRSYRDPLFLRFGHEMNGNWYPWSGVFNGAGDNEYGTILPDGPERYAEAWKHVHHLFRTEGANNVNWVWNVNPLSWPAEEWNMPQYYYPGDDYVDWVGMTLYGIFWGDYAPSDIIPLVYYLFPDKPMMIAEVSAADEANYYGDIVDTTTTYSYTRPVWVQEFFDSLEINFPNIHAFLWFNEFKNISTEADWRLTADPYPETLDVFRERIQNERYMSEVE